MGRISRAIRLPFAAFFLLVFRGFESLPSVLGQSDLPMSTDPLPWMNNRSGRLLVTGIRDCRPIEKCERCTFSDQKSIAACKETGRKQKMECTAFDGDGKPHWEVRQISIDDIGLTLCFLAFLADIKPTTDYFSCKYTEADDQFAMVSQFLCKYRPLELHRPHSLIFFSRFCCRFAFK